MVELSHGELGVVAVERQERRAAGKHRSPVVTLSGAFAGMLLGSATQLQAAAVRLLVLVALLLVQALSMVVTAVLVAYDILR